VTVPAAVSWSAVLWLKLVVTPLTVWLLRLELAS